MNLQDYYWYFESALPPKICDDIIQYAFTQKKEKAWVGRQEDGVKKPENPTEEEKQRHEKKRNSDVIWLDEHWIYKEIHPFINAANHNAQWNFEWDWTEPCQFTIYEEGQYYGWHCDSWNRPYNDPTQQNRLGKIRKLSMTISLSDPKDYEGGNLEFDFRNTKDWEIKQDRTKHLGTEIKPRGGVLVFPSFVWHRVTPVTKGTRYSLVAWNLGQPWR